ncbi:glucan biosynthesis protein G [Ralstonia sp. RL]|uniref:glucan biosynthesis protein G n=1 Tax=Ralstonia sp. RL TaxID=1839756 RepID=UPI000B22EACA|nr:glucan biosynthesis protein G [Ralstonia sp. RL]
MFWTAFKHAAPCARLACRGLALWLPAAAACAFGFDDVAARAKQLAAASYQEPPKNISRTLASLSYDQYRDIRYQPERAYWRGARLPFELAFFHQGREFDTPVRVHEIAGKSVHEIRFDPKAFHYGANAITQKDLTGLSFAGFRVHYPVNTAAYKDEVLVFLGASYFRAIGKGQVYGLSARGLAIDTALHSGEEFPRFTEFWIERPRPAAKTLTIYALLNSRRVAGAYRFVLKPDGETAMDVKARLYLRENVAKLGIAPLTSMYFFGENQRAQVEDYRPEVHDSDGLSIQSGTGEWIWRPLVNPRRLLVTSFALDNPLGFGLMQRDRRFASYEDLEARYESRPSAWVEPKGNWGPGRVELVQIPTPDETNDNIVAFWVPDKPPQPGQPYDIEYRLLWQKDADRRPPLSWVTQTRRGHGWVRKADGSIALSVDFEGPALKKLAAGEKVEAVVSADANARLLEVNAYRNAASDGWRMTARLARNDDKKPVELRAYLRSANHTLSETWSYILPPE